MYLFNRDKVLEQNYFKSVRSLKTARWQGFSSLGLIGGGLLLAVATKDSNCSGFCITDGQVFGWISAFFIGPLLGTSALLFEMSGRSKQKRVLSIYNSNYVELEDQSGVYLKLTNSSVGISLGITLYF